VRCEIYKNLMFRTFFLVSFRDPMANIYAITTALRSIVDINITDRHSVDKMTETDDFI
jgi:hypothetical protein